MKTQNNNESILKNLVKKKGSVNGHTLKFLIGSGNAVFFIKLMIKVSNYKIFIAGDFNINLLDYSFLTSKFLDVMLALGLYPLIYKPTRPASGLY